MNTTTATSPTFADIARAATDAAPHAYYVRTVSSFRLVGHDTAYAATAQQLAELYVALGYVAVDVAPAVPVNGYPEGLPVAHGDVAAIDTRTT